MNLPPVPTSLFPAHTDSICQGCRQFIPLAAPCAYPLTRWGYLTVHPLCKPSPWWAPKEA